MKICGAAIKRSAAPFRAAAERSEQAQFRFAGKYWRRAGALAEADETASAFYGGRSLQRARAAP
jgi:hypothetical protein